MNKPIIEKTVTEHGSIILSFYGKNHAESMWFDDETQLRAFAYLLRLMVEMGASSAAIECPDQEEVAKSDTEAEQPGDKPTTE